MKLLAIETNSEVQQQLKTQAFSDGWQIKTASSLERGFDILGYFIPDLILLDILAFDPTNRQCAIKLQGHASTPLILLVEREHIEQLGRMLLKYRDFLCKPICRTELKFRIQTVLERSEDDHLVYGPIYIDQNNKQISISGHPLHLTPKEYLLLRMLVMVRGRVVSNEEILAQAWANSKRASASDVQQYIHHLRQKMKAQVGYHDCIYYDKGLGYHLNCYQCNNHCAKQCSKKYEEQKIPLVDLPLKDQP